MCFRKEAAGESGLQRDDSQVEDLGGQQQFMRRNARTPTTAVAADSGRMVHLGAISKVEWTGVGCLPRYGR